MCMQGHKPPTGALSKAQLNGTLSQMLPDAQGQIPHQDPGTYLAAGQCLISSRGPEFIHTRLSPVGTAKCSGRGWAPSYSART